MRFVVIYDACVLYPAPRRDFLVRLATVRLFAAKWSETIHDEWMRNVLAARPELTNALQRTRELMDQAVPDCLVEGYEPLIDSLNLPDPNDRHVLAAAISAGAQTIVTHNLTDFPDHCLNTYGIEASDPDTFVVQQMDLHEAAVVAVARDHRAALKNPPKSVDEYLETLAAQGLLATTDLLRNYAEFI
jgi:predicted nucleic acid-binding protein